MGVVKKLNETSPRSEDPKGSAIPLMGHQKAIVHRALALEEQALSPQQNEHTLPIGIMADPPSSGKSYCLLALLLFQKWKAKTKETTLLIIPHNLHTQWLEYIHGYSKQLTVKSLIHYEDISSLYMSTMLLFQYDILLTTSLYYRPIYDAIQSTGQQLQRIVIDEIDSISWFIGDPFPAKMCWFISASFRPDKIGHYDMRDEDVVKNTIQCKPEFITSCMRIMPPKVYNYQCTDQILACILNPILTEDEKKQINAMDYRLLLRNIAEVATDSKELVGILMREMMVTIHKQDEVLDKHNKDLLGQSPNYCKAKEIYNFERIIAMLKREQKRDTDVEKLLEQYKRTERACLPHCIERCQHVIQRNEKDIRTLITLVKDHLGDDYCPICLESDKPLYTYACCASSFCYPCIKQSRMIANKEKCIVCRRLIATGSGPVLDNVVVAPGRKDTRKMTYYNMPKNYTFNDIPKSLSKTDCLTSILSICKGHTHSKIMIFSDYPEVFKTLRKLFLATKTTHIEMDGGSVEAVTKDIASYKTGDTRVLMANSLLYGAGLNLENTTDIILVHKTDNESQIIGRGARYGRTSELRVHKLLYENEI